MADKYVMRYLPEHNITFIHNPKTAGTSIGTWLDNNFITKRGRKHGHWIEVAEYFPKTVFTFGVVRNPWSRLASWYLYANPAREPFDHWLTQRLQVNESGLSFNPTLTWAKNWYTIATPQADWFGDNINLVLRFENLQEDFEKIKKLLTCNADLPIMNVNDSYDYRTLYTDDLAELVRDIYIKDVIRYDYDFEI